MARPSAGRQVLVAGVFLAASAAVAFLGSLATIPNTDGGWYEEAAKVPWSPPNWLFGPAWSLLYVMIAVAGFLIWRAGATDTAAQNRARGVLTIFAAQMVLNLAWTPVFFAGYPIVGKPAWWAGIVIIIALIIAVITLIITASRHSKTAAWMLVPYAGWLLFAATLNAGIIALN